MTFRARIPARQRLLLLLLLPAAAVACRPAPETGVTEPPGDPDVVAVYRGGTVSAGDLDQAILELPPSLRQPDDGETHAAWYEELIRELVIDRLLLAEAELLASGDDPEMRAVHEEARRQTVLEVFLERHPPEVAEVTPEDARRDYQAHLEDYDRIGRRLVSHLFKSRRPGEPIEVLEEDVAELRQRAVAGEHFGTLAAEHSDSESRHRQGKLGWLRRDQLASELAEVIFSLPEGVPSMPLLTAEGIHLFQVEKIVEAKRFSFEEVENLIARRLLAERQREAVARLADGLPALPAGTFIAEPDELAALLAAGEPQAPVLRIGDYEVTVARLRALVSQSQAQAGGNQPPSREQAAQLLESLGRRERIYRHARSEGLDEDPEVAERLERREQRSLLRTLRQRSIQRQLNEEPERLQEYYDNNKRRFSSPLRFELRRLAVATTPASAHRAMQRLERAAAETGPAAQRLAAAAADLGGTVEELGWLGQGELARLHPRWVRLVSGLRAGQLSPPLSGESSVEMLEVVSRQEPEPLPFATVLERVRAAYLEDHLQELYQEWVDRMLADSGLQIFSDRLENLAVSRPGAGPDGGSVK